MTASIEVAVIGAGQAGLATSWYLSQAGIDHAVFESGRVAETWRSRRWDSFCLVTPNWAVKLPGATYAGSDPDGFMPVAELTRNLWAIIERAQARRIAVVLAGMEAPPNHGFDYTAGFHNVYPAVAKKYHVPLVPFLLQGVGGISALNQADGIHPTAEGARIVADNVWTVLKPVLDADSRRADAGGAPAR